MLEGGANGSLTDSLPARLIDKFFMNSRCGIGKKYVGTSNKAVLLRATKPSSFSLRPLLGANTTRSSHLAYQR
jgi:hypothetical protein